MEGSPWEENGLKESRSIRDDSFRPGRKKTGEPREETTGEKPAPSRQDRRKTEEKPVPDQAKEKEGTSQAVPAKKKNAERENPPEVKKRRLRQSLLRKKLPLQPKNQYNSRGRKVNPSTGPRRKRDRTTGAAALQKETGKRPSRDRIPTAALLRRCRTPWLFFERLKQGLKWRAGRWSGGLSLLFSGVWLTSAFWKILKKYSFSAMLE
jgi:hypothetical protein